MASKRKTPVSVRCPLNLRFYEAREVAILLMAGSVSSDYNAGTRHVFAKLSRQLQKMVDAGLKQMKATAPSKTKAEPARATRPARLNRSAKAR